MNRFCCNLFAVMSSYSMYSMEMSTQIIFLELIGDDEFQAKNSRKCDLQYSLKDSDLDSHKGKVLKLLRNEISKKFPDKLVKIYTLGYDSKNNVFANEINNTNNLINEINDTLDSKAENIIRGAINHSKNVIVFFHPFDKPVDDKKKTSPVVDNVKSKVNKKKTNPIVNNVKSKVDKKKTSPVIGDIKGKDGKKKTGTAVRDGKGNTDDKQAGTSKDKKGCCC